MAVCPACGTENPEGSRFCNACGERLPDAVVATPDVRKTVSVVFCDVVGSTALGERLDPETLRRVMSRYFATMTEAIERHGGTVEKFIGDAVMAVFGIPTTHEDDAVRAVRAADEMRDGLRVLNKELERDHGATLTCRIGVNTGEVIAGDATVRQALVTGDAVNVAARLEQAAPAGEVLLSGTTYRLVRDAVVVETVEPLELKGKSERVAAHRLIAIHPGAAGVARRLDSPLVGRRRQLARLRQAFEEVVTDRVCHLFTILGSPGVGKSRLMQEAIEEFALDAAVVRGRCLSYGEGITYWPIAEIVREAVGHEGVEGMRDLTSAIAALLPEDPSVNEVALRVAQLAGAGPDVAVPGEEIGWAVRRFFEGLARVRPLVVVLDDLHWAEPPLLDLIDEVADLSRDAPILIACMARPELVEVRPDWGGGKLHASIDALEPLSSDESECLLQNLLGGATLSDPVERQIVEASEGNPLFVEETISMLIDDGLLRREGETWTAVEDLGEVTVPPTIQALFEARLDRLDEAERALLARASVVGLRFYVDAVRELGGEEDCPSTMRRLQQLVRRDLVRPDASDLPGEDAFRFHHTLLRDAAYQMLPKEVRADLHERFAGWLERVEPVDADEFIGYHLAEAYAYRLELGPEDERTRDLGLRAADRFSKAGGRATDRGDTRSAGRLYGRAVDLRAPDDPTLARDLIETGWAAFDQDRADEGARAFERALEATRVSGDDREQAHAALGAAFGRWTLDPEGGATAMQELVEALIPRFEAAGDERGLAIAYTARGQVHWNACRFDAARTDGGSGLPHALAIGDRTIEVWCSTMRFLGALLGSAPLDEVDAVAGEFQAQAASFPSLRIPVLHVQGQVAAMRGDFETAHRRIEEAREISFEVRGQETAGLLEGWYRVEMLAGDPEAAEEVARRVYEMLVASGDVAHASTAAGERARACLRLGRDEEAWRLAAECRETSASDDVVNQVIWRRVEAQVLAHEGRFDEAAALIEEAIGWIERSDMLFEHAETFLDAAEVYAAGSRLDDARSALRRAHDAAARKGATVLEARAEERLAALAG